MIKPPDIVDRLLQGSDLPTRMELDSRYILQPILQDAASEILNLRAEVNRLLTVIYLNRDKIDGGYEAVRQADTGQQGS